MNRISVLCSSPTYIHFLLHYLTCCLRLKLWVDFHEPDLTFIHSLSTQAENYADFHTGLRNRQRIQAC